MTAIYETAYPRIKSDISTRELDDIYTPSDDEIRFIPHNHNVISVRVYVRIYKILAEKRVIIDEF